MASSQITWRDVQQMPDDGRRREAIEGELYVIVDPDPGAVEAWRFGGEEPRCERHTDRLPVRVGGETVGEIELGEVFRREG